jgi:hypothetical protein
MIGQHEYKLSQQTEILLAQLFSGVDELRERALLAVNPRDRDGIREAVKVREDGCALLEMLMADLGAASTELRNNYASQYWRRNAIRALAATVEGIVFSLKRLALATATVMEIKLEVEELEFLKEESTSIGKKARLPGFRDNLKRTFKLFAKICGTSCSTDFGQGGFNALCQTFELRHRVMHPKSSVAFYIEDDETKRAGEAIEWLSCELQRLIGGCEDSLGNHSPTS